MGFFYAFTFRSTMAKTTCEIETTGIKYHHDIPIAFLATKNAANVTQTFMQYKQPPMGLYMKRNGFIGFFTTRSKNVVQKPKIWLGWITKSMKIVTMAAVIAVIADHEMIENCGPLIKLAAMNPIMVPIPTKNVWSIALTILFIVVFGFEN
jgi:hypothetical protein